MPYAVCHMISKSYQNIWIAWPTEEPLIISSCPITSHSIRLSTIGGSCPLWATIRRMRHILSQLRNILRQLRNILDSLGNSLPMC